MSETRALYGVSGQTGPNPSSLLPFYNSAYVSPTNDDLKAIKQQFNLSGAAIARLTGVKPRTVRKWLAPATVMNHTPVPYAAWRVLLIETEMVKPSGIDVVRTLSVIDDAISYDD